MVCHMAMGVILGHGRYDMAAMLTEMMLANPLPVLSLVAGADEY